MQSDDLPDIYLKNLGRFKIKKKRLEWMIDELKKDKNNNIDKLKKAINVRK